MLGRKRRRKKPIFLTPQGRDTTYLCLVSVTWPRVSKAPSHCQGEAQKPPGTPTRRTVPPGPKAVGAKQMLAMPKVLPGPRGPPGLAEGPWGPEGTGGAGMLLVPWAVSE